MMRKLFVLLILVIFPLISLAAEKPVWVDAVGEALMGEIETQKEAKDRARLDARNQAIEQAVGVFIRSHTLVSNSQVAEDLIYAAVRGKITKEKILFSDWDAQERNLYKIRIKALVEPVYPEKGEGLSVKLSLSKSDLREGDEVKIFYTVSEDAYVYIFSVAADGSVTLLLPNAHLADNFVRANQAGQFPPAGNPISLKAMFLPGYEGKTAEERIKIIATKKRNRCFLWVFKRAFFRYITKSQPA